MLHASSAEMEPPKPSAPTEQKDPWEDTPLLMSKLPDDWNSNEALAGIQALMYDEQTPDERATALKEQGNEILKHPHKWKRKEALECYTRGLQDAKDPALRLALYLNRAHAHLMFENYGHAWEDSVNAIAIDVRWSSSSVPNIPLTRRVYSRRTSRHTTAQRRRRSA